MARIISKIDIKLVIPPYFKNLTKSKSLEIELKEGEITEVPDNIAEYFTKSRPHVFRYADEEDFNEEENNENNEVIEEEFNVQEFFETNADNIEEAIQNITERKKLLAIAKYLGLTNYVKQTNERIKERIINDIRIQKQSSGENN